MTYSQSGLHLTEQFESCRLFAYQDTKGIWTIGWGHTADVHEYDTCTQAQADTWLAEDIQWAAQAVNALVAAPLTQGEFDALVDFVFNAGSGAFAKSTMRVLINEGRYETAAAQFELWDHAGGKVVAGLLRRRVAEEAEFNHA